MYFCFFFYSSRAATQAFTFDEDDQSPRMVDLPSSASSVLTRFKDRVQRLWHRAIRRWPVVINGLVLIVWFVFLLCWVIGCVCVCFCSGSPCCPWSLTSASPCQFDALLLWRWLFFSFLKLDKKQFFFFWCSFFSFQVYIIIYRNVPLGFVMYS